MVQNTYTLYYGGNIYYLRIEKDGKILIQRQKGTWFNPSSRLKNVLERWIKKGMKTRGRQCIF